MTTLILLLICFLKAWSIVYGLIILGVVYALMNNKVKDVLFNWETCLMWSLWITSIYSWTI